jgi:hypothetical protein
MVMMPNEEAMMYVVIATYIKNNQIINVSIEGMTENLRTAQLKIEDVWELDLENADVWVEELSDRDEIFPKKINPMLFVCGDIPNFDRVEYRIVESETPLITAARQVVKERVQQKNTGHHEELLAAIDELKDVLGEFD